VSETDLNLAERLLSGDPEGFDEFVQSYRRKLFQYSFLMCGHREDAEEVAQETLMRVFSNLDQLRDPQNLKSWVFRIAKNECLMKRRKSVFAPEHELSLEDLHPRAGAGGESQKIEIADWSGLPDDAAQRSEYRRIIGEAIRELPETYRAVILLRDVEELTTEEAAAVLDISTDLVKTRLHRARLALRQKLDGYLRSEFQRQSVGVSHG
jgi:RNA polymerase sigma-70 factor (ECF subfamily)